MVKPFLSSFCITPLITLLLCLLCSPVQGRIQQASTGSCLEILRAVRDTTGGLRNIPAALNKGSDLQDSRLYAYLVCRRQDQCAQVCSLCCPQSWVCFWVTLAHEMGVTNPNSPEAVCDTREVWPRWKARSCGCANHGEGWRWGAGLWQYGGGTKLLLCHGCRRKRE